MAKISSEILLDVPLDVVLATVCSAARLGQLFHNVDRTEGDETKATWHLKSPFRATLGTSALQATVQKLSANTWEWRAEAPHLHWTGRFVVGETEGGRTSLKLDLQIEDTGPLAAVHNAMIAVQIKNVAKLFEKNLRGTLEEQHD